MAILPTQLARVSNQLRSSVSQNGIARTQQELLKVQNELSTGRRLSVASDDPGDAAVVQQLQKTLEQRESYLTNLQRAQSHLGEVDSTLGHLGDMLQRAQTIASANVGSASTDDERQGAAAVVESIYNEAVSLANKQFQDVYLFGGDRATDPPFVSEGGGVKFVGSSRVLANDYDENTTRPFMVDGAEVFGALSTRVEGTTDLSPAVTVDTRLADLRGAADGGIRPGQIRVGNGSTSATVDLAGADTIGDVIDAINAAGVGGVTASIASDGVSLQLSGGAADNISVQEVGAATTAEDLGLLRTAAAGPGVALDGQDVKARVTPLTRLADLRQGAGIDQTSGMVITNGEFSSTVSFSAATTVEDLLNGINRSGTHVLAEINADGTGINILNPTQGTEMRVAENGGQTATQLGVRSFGPDTPQGALNGGRGVRTVDGPDFRVTAADGSTFDVDLGSEGNVADVIGVINAAATAANVAVTAGFSSSGNGITLTDATGGPGTPRVEALNYSEALADLGLTQPASGGVITGSDVGPVTASGVFANLAKLRDALRNNDEAGITAAAEALTEDHDRAIRLRGETGARVQELESRQGRIEDQNVATKALLAELADTDFTDAVTRFQTLQNALQATLQTGAQVLELSLLDFLG